MVNHKNMIIGVVVFVCILIVIALAGLYGLTHGRMSTNVVTFSYVAVSTSTIELKGGTFFTGFGWYNGYKADYKDGVLYVDLVVSMIHRPGMQGTPFSISIPNTYGTINRIYLRGHGSEGDKLIWQQK